MPATFLLDNTVVSNFGQVQRFDILQALIGGHVFLTLQVLDETRAGVSAGKVPGLIVERALDEGWLSVVSVSEGQEQHDF